MCDHYKLLSKLIEITRNRSFIIFYLFISRRKFQFSTYPNKGAIFEVARDRRKFQTMTDFSVNSNRFNHSILVYFGTFWLRNDCDYSKHKLTFLMKTITLNQLKRHKKYAMQLATQSKISTYVDCWKVALRWRNLKSLVEVLKVCICYLTQQLKSLHTNSWCIVLKTCFFYFSWIFKHRPFSKLSKLEPKNFYTIILRWSNIFWIVWKLTIINSMIRETCRQIEWNFYLPL